MADSPAKPWHRARTVLMNQHPGLRFLLVGGLAFVTDAGTLWFCHGVLGLAIWLATSFAFVTSYIVNFGLNRVLTFADQGARDGAMRDQTVKFTLLVAVNFVLTEAIMNGLTSHAVGMNYMVAKVLSTGFLTFLNFFAYRHWVFAAKPAPRDRPAEVAAVLPVDEVTAAAGS
ncbi:hypothetical protein GCM10009839_39470 [Catenulispora yoronensis]|uniref:GtrA/DPMS transmembrane domain-containing protein n=1 Tax=Catenulispora yoronensis TaxID=450799 RepID=A0ABP5FZF6_9ACTN